MKRERSYSASEFSNSKKHKHNPTQEYNTFGDYLHRFYIKWVYGADQYLLDNIQTPEKVQLALIAGASIEPKTPLFISPLIRAIQLGANESVLCLLRHGVNPNALGRAEKTGPYYIPIELAYDQEEEEIFSNILNGKAKKDNTSNTDKIICLLEKAIRSKKIFFIEKLIEHLLISYPNLKSNYWRHLWRETVNTNNPLVIKCFLKNLPQIAGSSLEEWQKVENISYFKFVCRIQDTLTSHPVRNVELSRLINEKELHQCLQYILKLDKNAICNIPLGGALRFPKEETHLSRTLTILRDKMGEFKLILETKQKCKDGSKQILPLAKGTTKKGKPSWRIDGLVQEYFNLVASKNGKLHKIREELKNEVELTQKFLQSPNIDTLELGPSFTKNFDNKVSVYSKKAIKDLRGFLKNHKLTHAELHYLIADLLQGLKAIHDKGLVHQDLKPENILVCKENGRYTLKISDFGLASLHGDSQDVALATVGYESPEIAYYNSKPSVHTHRYFYDYYKTNPTLGYELSKSKGWVAPNEYYNYGIPHTANDMWAAGIVIYELLHGFKPYACNSVQKEIQNNELLSKLLVERNSRISCDAALTCHNKIRKSLIKAT